LALLVKKTTENNIDLLKQEWDTWGKTDAFWAVLTDPSKKGNRWDESDFFATGKQHVDWIMENLKKAGVSINPQRALDFGCGVGRITRALTRHFKKTIGVDIAPSMIQKARELNAQFNCRFEVTPDPALAPIQSERFDFITSWIVFQHMNKELATEYLATLAQLLEKDGVLFVQVASHRYLPGIGLLAFLRKWVLRQMGPTIRMHGFPRAEVEAALRKAGLNIVAVQDDHSCGWSWKSYSYLAQKR